MNEELGGAGTATAVPPAVYQRVVRVTSLLFLIAAMVVEVLTGGDNLGNLVLVIVLLALGMVAILLFQDVLPPGSLGRWRLPIEAAAVIIVLTLLLAFTGGHTSPFFFGYVLFLGVGALWSSGLGPALLAFVTSVAYLVGVVGAFNNLPSTQADFGRVAFNIVALTLVTYVAAVVGREQRRAREDALRLSRFDSLTGLHSRDYFTSLLEAEILRAGRSGRPFALLMMDLDGLKAANDRFGHASGDQLLRAVAETLSGDIRATDLAARYGGDEFVVFLPETDLAGALLVADKVRIDISRLALPHDGQVIRTSVSIGLVTYPDDGRSSMELMRRADLAMYEAKRRGRDQVVRFARETRAGASPVPPAAATPVATPAAPTPAAPTPAAPAPTPAQGQPLETVVAEPVAPPPADVRPETVSVPMPVPVPSPTAGVIAVGSYPDPTAQAGAGQSIAVGQPLEPEVDRPVAATTAPDFAPPPPLPENLLTGDVPPQSPGRPPWEGPG